MKLLPFSYHRTDCVLRMIHLPIAVGLLLLATSNFVSSKFTCQSKLLQHKIDFQTARSFAISLLTSCALLSTTPPCYASTRTVGVFATSGLVFKDTLKVVEFKDPKVDGVAIYLADFERPLTEKLANDFFSDPSSTSLSCAQSADKITFLSNLPTGTEGEEIFEDKRSLFFKTVKVRRIFDKETNNLIYASYSTRLDKGADSNKSRFKSSLCAIHIPTPAPVTPSQPAATQ